MTRTETTSTTTSTELTSPTTTTTETTIVPISSTSPPVTATIAPLRNGRFLQFSDFHYDPQYSVNGIALPSVLCHANASDRPDHKLGLYGDYICDASANLIKNMLSAAKSFIPSPDFILWTGDSFPHIDDYNVSYLESTIKEATRFVDEAFPGALVLPAFGNHDFSPANAFPDSDHEIYRYVYNLWKHWITEANEETFLKGGYYKYRLPDRNVTILVLNTNLYYRFNKAYDSFSNKTDPAGQFQFMIDILNHAQQNGEIVHIASHIAPGVFERTPSFTWMYPEYNQKFIDITIQYASTIKWMIFGHHHTDTFHIVSHPSTGEAVQVYYMAPAVTPWFSTLPGAGSNNPSFRIYDYDVQSEELFDATTYYINLDALNRDNTTSWQKEYSYRIDYNIAPGMKLNAIAMKKVLDSIKTNDDMFAKYLKYNSVLFNVTEPFNETFRAAQLCSLEYPDFPAYNRCMSPPTTAETASYSISTVITPTATDTETSRKTTSMSSPTTERTTAQTTTTTSAASTNTVTLTMILISIVASFLNAFA